MPPYITEFIFPGVVAFLAAAFSYVGTYVHGRSVDLRKSKIQRSSYLQLLQLHIQRINASFEQLKSGHLNDGIFSLQEISYAKGISDKLQQSINDITIIEDNDLRSNILSTLEDVISLVDDINNLETFQVSYLGELSRADKETQKDRRDLRITMLGHEVLFRGSGFHARDANDSNSSGRNDLADQANIILDNILEKVTRNEQMRQDRLEENKTKRILFNTRIVDVQGKMRSLTDNVGKYRGNNRT